MHYEGVCANAGPHSQKLHGRVTNICRNRMRQQYRSAMVPPQHEPTSCQIDVVSSRQVSMLKTVLLAVLNYSHMLGFACSRITLDTHQVSFNSNRTASLIRHPSFRGVKLRHFSMFPVKNATGVIQVEAVYFTVKTCK